MSIVIKRVQSQKTEACVCLIKHDEHVFQVDVLGALSELSKKVDQRLIVEIAYKQLMSAKIIADFSDASSCIFLHEGLYTIRGRVHSCIELEGMIYDIYLQNCADFVCVSSQELDFELHTGDGVELRVTDLCFHPTNT